MRLFEATGVGALLMTEASHNLDSLFVPGDEVVSYEGVEDLIEKLAHYREHEEDRARIAAAGQARTLSEHSYERIGRARRDARVTSLSLGSCARVLHTLRQQLPPQGAGHVPLARAALCRRSISPRSASTSSRWKRSARLELDRLSVVSLDELEAHDPALLSTKTDRTPVEYCWTATPALPLYMLETRPELDEITYLDADLLFFADPEPLFEEMGQPRS